MLKGETANLCPIYLFIYLYHKPTSSLFMNLKCAEASKPQQKMNYSPSWNIELVLKRLIHIQIARSFQLGHLSTSPQAKEMCFTEVQVQVPLQYFEVQGTYCCLINLLNTSVTINFNDSKMLNIRQLNIVQPELTVIKCFIKRSWQIPAVLESVKRTRTCDQSNVDEKCYTQTLCDNLRWLLHDGDQ